MVELMVGIVISIILIGVLLAAMTQLSTTVRTVDSKIDAFQGAEAAFDLMTQTLSDATLNTYYDYDSSSAPTTYLRRSDLHFLVEQNSNLTTAFPNSNANSGQSAFFQSPVGYSNNSTYAHTPGLLNACGYFIQFGPDSASWPTIFTAGSRTIHYRYRLMQAVQSTEFNGIFGDLESTTAEGGSGTFPTTPWFKSLGSVALPIAENVIALVIWPQSPAVTSASGVSTDYQYSSRQGLPTPSNSLQSEQLPQILQVTIVAIDNASALRLDTGSPSPPTVIENALKGGSTGTGLFKTASTTQYTADLASLEQALGTAHIQYQVLATSVTLRESKWSNGQ